MSTRRSGRNLTAQACRRTQGAEILTVSDLNGGVVPEHRYGSRCVFSFPARDSFHVCLLASSPPYELTTLMMLTWRQHDIAYIYVAETGE